jgi:hypothetical protein
VRIGSSSFRDETSTEQDGIGTTGLTPSPTFSTAWSSESFLFSPHGSGTNGRPDHVTASALVPNSLMTETSIRARAFASTSASASTTTCKRRLERSSRRVDRPILVLLHPAHSEASSSSYQHSRPYLRQPGLDRGTKRNSGRLTALMPREGEDGYYRPGAVRMGKLPSL